MFVTNTARVAQVCAAVVFCVGPAGAAEAFTTFDAPGNSGYTEAYGAS
jgi:hypothetical protein